MAHLQPRDLSSKYVQIAGPINSLNSSKQLLPPSCCLAIVQMPEQPGNRLSSQAHGPWAQLLVCFFAKHGHQLPRVGDDQRTDIQALQFPTLGSPPRPRLSNSFRNCSALEQHQSKLPGNYQKPWGHMATDVSRFRRWRPTFFFQGQRMPGSFPSFGAEKRGTDCQNCCRLPLPAAHLSLPGRQAADILRTPLRTRVKC